MNHAQRLRSKKQRTKAQRQHQNRSKLIKRTKPTPHHEPRPPKDSSPPPHHPKLLDLPNVIDALALYLHNTIKTHEQPKSRRGPLFRPSGSSPSLFDARDIRSTLEIPSVPDIRTYVRDIIERRRLSAETVVVSVVLLTRTGIRLRSSNWARLLLVAFLLANKEAEDVYNVWNVRFVGIIPDLPLYEINLLEMEFLKSIKYRLHVEPSTFREFSDRLWLYIEPGGVDIPKKEKNPINGIFSEILKIPEIMKKEIIPEVTKEIIPEIIKKEIISEITKKEIIPEITKMEIITKKEKNPEITKKSIIPEITKKAIIPEITKKEIIPEFTKKEIIPEFTKKKIIPEITKKGIIPEFSLKKKKDKKKGRKIGLDVLLQQPIFSILGKGGFSGEVEGVVKSPLVAYRPS